MGCKEGVACKWPWLQWGPGFRLLEGTVRQSVVSRVVGSGWRMGAGKVAALGELWMCHAEEYAGYLYSIVSLG